MDHTCSPIDRRKFVVGTAASLAFGLPDHSSAQTERNIPMSDKIIRNGNAELFTQSIGDPRHPPVLLIMGVMASMLWWPVAFCERLAKADRYVIRYDNRDTGLSTNYPPGKPEYTLADMVTDAIAILDGYDIRSAHVVGMSLGGMIAQRLALTHPDRVTTLSLISSTPIGVEGLPPSPAKYAAHSATGEAVDWSNDASILDFILRDMAMIASTEHPHDAKAAKDFLQRDMDRARNFASATNHFMLFGSGDNFARSVSELTIPPLVIHGTSDPVYPFAHGEALAGLVKGSRLLRIEGGGHEIHPMDIEAIAAALVEHTRSP